MHSTFRCRGTEPKCHRRWAHGQAALPLASGPGGRRLGVWVQSSCAGGLDHPRSSPHLHMHSLGSGSRAGRRSPVRRGPSPVFPRTVRYRHQGRRMGSAGVPGQSHLAARPQQHYCDMRLSWGHYKMAGFAPEKWLRQSRAGTPQCWAESKLSILQSSIGFRS